MKKIDEIFNNDIYSPFLEYCQKNNFTYMADLLNCSFNKIHLEPNINPALASRIRSIFIVYKTKNPDEFKKPTRTRAKTVVKSTMPKEELIIKLEEYFKQNSQKLINIIDVSKHIGSGVKRTEIVETLNSCPWCKVVDNMTYFYSPAE